MNSAFLKESIPREGVADERNTVVVAALIIMTAAAYWASTLALWTVWIDPDFGAGHAHGLLIGALSMWTLFRNRDAIAGAPARPALWAYPLLLVGSLASLVFWRAGIQSLHMLLLPVLAMLAVLSVLGTQVARAVVFPLGYLYFSMPAWGLLGPWLQHLTSRAVAVLCPLFGIPAHVAGNLVNLPGVGVFEITPACSGINFLVVGLAVAALIGEMMRASIQRRFWLLAVMAAGCIASNWLRALLIIGIGYATDLRFTLATRDHVIFGWIIFAAALVGYVWWATGPAAAAGAGATKPGIADFRPSPTHNAHWMRPPFIAAALMLCAAPIWAFIASPRHPVASTLPILMPTGRQGWKGPMARPDPAWEPEFVGEHAQQKVAYQQETDVHTVEVLSVGYARQGQGHELVNEGNSLLGDRGLTATAGGLVSTHGQVFRELTITDGNGRRSLIWSVYDIGGRTFVTPLYSQLWYGWRSFRATPFSAILAFRTTCEPSCREAQSTLQSFLQSMGPPIFATVQLP